MGAMDKDVSEILKQVSPIPARERHYRWLLKNHPVGDPALDDFLYVDDVVPMPPPGKMLLRCLWLSLDPFQRLTWNATPRNAEIVPLYGTLLGDIVGEVVLSNHPDFVAGDIINEVLGWQNYALSDGRGHYIHNRAGARKVDPALGPISTACGVLGRTGLTAYFSIMRDLMPQPCETMVVSTAAGAVGSLAVQVAKIMGVRVVGLTSTDEKCAWITELGCDDVINYKAANNLSTAIARAAPGGVDMYYDNVGGPIAEAALANMNPGGRVTRVGVSAAYSQVNDDGTPWTWPGNQPMFIIHDHVHDYPEGLAALSQWIKEGQLTYREDVIDGLENAMAGWLDMMTGGNRGKRIVRIAPNPDGIA
jgi:NADPH-dependent curcumin reductase CurA